MDNISAFERIFRNEGKILMEGAIGERLKSEFGIELDHDIAIASVVKSTRGKKTLALIFNQYIYLAEKYNLPLMITTPTRRANLERIERSKYDHTVFSDNVSMLVDLRKRSSANVFIGGLMGCKGDAYSSEGCLNQADSYNFHRWQANQLSNAGVDYLYAGIMPALEEALGMARAMAETGLPYIISFMLLENGRLLDGTSLSDAIRTIDDQVERKPLCYMSNCVHPKRIAKALCQSYNKDPLIIERFRGVQVNASNLTPTELEQSVTIENSSALELANEIDQLNAYLQLKIVGGCCGTDHTHIEEIAKRMKSK